MGLFEIEMWRFPVVAGPLVSMAKAAPELGVAMSPELLMMVIFPG
jgi:hypothetical protein